MLPDQNVKEKIRSLLDITGKELIKINNGSKAPDFRSLDISGKLHTLTDYQNKVVLIDLWASWCGPCRYQTKFLKKTVEKFKNDNRVAFISISVNDKLPEWQKALLQDKPTWLQLIDSEKSAAKGYLAYSIPKFVLINKLGNIVTLDAPMPDDGNKLEELINAEIAK